MIICKGGFHIVSEEQARRSGRERLKTEKLSSERWTLLTVE